MDENSKERIENIRTFAIACFAVGFMIFTIGFCRWSSTLSSSTTLSSNVEVTPKPESLTQEDWQCIRAFGDKWRFVSYTSVGFLQERKVCGNGGETKQIN